MTTVTSPLAGEAIGLANVPDPVFSGAMVGPGTAIKPNPGPGEAVSPVDGTIVSMHPHAFVVLDDQGHGVLTHLGIDTVQLNGEGFELLVEKGDTVKRGQPVIKWNPTAVEAAGKSSICPIVALEAAPEQLSEVADAGQLAAGDTLFQWQ
ncbi:PTS sugar transporter subunit IIA [Streptacidiphilus jiangxiensis]|uniref:PTS system, glucose subfamily, IIA component n=1 Tax=Streptacidiphilus jiangxiensis TaxID=235985 RepID=A0A1H7UF60_STRJI|nr:PTS glucose transporter subunit IIA [Streptacidiphilus jiangxiensis]SEL95355.1 PTS system, glucose subfamily, IIA component [Streptacidiphilus jiangxiensis]